MLSGYAEKEHISDFAFETQRRTYHSYGYAQDPSKPITDEDLAEDNKQVISRYVCIYDSKPINDM